MTRVNMQDSLKENSNPTRKTGEQQSKDVDFGFGPPRCVLVDNGQETVCLSSDTDSEYSSSQEGAKTYPTGVYSATTRDAGNSQDFAISRDSGISSDLNRFSGSVPSPAPGPVPLRPPDERLKRSARKSTGFIRVSNRASLQSRFSTTTRTQHGPGRATTSDRISDFTSIGARMSTPAVQQGSTPQPSSTNTSKSQPQSNPSTSSRPPEPAPSTSRGQPQPAQDTLIRPTQRTAGLGASGRRSAPTANTPADEPQPSTSRGHQAQTVRRDPFKSKRTLMKSQRLALVNQEQSIQRHVPTGLGIGKGGMRRLTELHERVQRERRGVGPSRRINPIVKVMTMRPFHRYVNLLFGDIKEGTNVTSMQAKAVEALLVSSEQFLMRFFEQCSFAVIHGGRVTLMPRDIVLTFRMDENYSKFGFI